MHFGQPDYDLPGIPRDLTTWGDEALMELFAAFVAWQNYAATQLAEAEVTEERAEARQRFIEAEGMVRQWGSTDKVTVARAQRELTPEVKQIREEVLLAYARRKMTGVIYANCERAAALVSRELSRRLGRDPVERRAMRWRP